MVKILGLVDICTAFIILFAIYGYKAPAILFGIIGFTMVGKFLMSTQNMFGWFDLFAVIIMILATIIVLPKWFLIVAGLAFIKGVMSLV